MQKMATYSIPVIFISARLAVYFLFDCTIFYQLNCSCLISACCWMGITSSKLSRVYFSYKKYSSHVLVGEMFKMSVILSFYSMNEKTVHVR